MPPSKPDTEPAASAFRIQAVPPGRPWVWLARGWVDLLRCPLPGLVHGAVAAAFGALLLALAGDRFWLLAGSFSGFLLVAPLVATGLYAVRSNRAGAATWARRWPRGSRATTGWSPSGCCWRWPAPAGC